MSQFDQSPVGAFDDLHLQEVRSRRSAEAQQREIGDYRLKAPPSPILTLTVKSQTSSQITAEDADETEYVIPTPGGAWAYAEGETIYVFEAQLADPAANPLRVIPTPPAPEGSADNYLAAQVSPSGLLVYDILRAR